MLILIRGIQASNTALLYGETIMLSVNDTIYYMDYEESHSSYTIIRIDYIKNNSFMPKGYYYYVHSDLLPKGTGYYFIRVDEVDSDNVKDRFFSSPNKAHEGYIKYKNSGGNSR